MINSKHGNMQMKKGLLTIFALSTLACSKSGTLDIGGNGGDTGSIGTTDTSGTTDITDVNTSTETDTETTETNIFEEWEGDYDGEMELYLWGGSWSECNKKKAVSFEVGIDGEVYGSGDCSGDWSQYEAEFYGEVNENAEVSGVVTISTDFRGGGGSESFDFEFSGEIISRQLEIEWIGAADMGYWEIDVKGEATSSR